MAPDAESRPLTCTRGVRAAALLASAVLLAACATPRDSRPGAGAVPPAAPNDSAQAAPPAPAAAPAPPRRRITTIVELPAGSIPDFYALPAPPGSLLERLVGQFALPDSHNAAIERETRWFAAHPDYLERVFERARRYLPHVAAEIESRSLPGELAFLPIVESAFDPFAYSHGRASGMWQIIPGTGTRFGLKQNWWYDGRRDVVDSTRGALDYLEYLVEHFDGDWLLAIAAYNSGEGNVRRAIRANAAAGRPTDFWSLRLPAETEAYVPRLIGLTALLRNPATHGLDLPFLPDAPAFAQVDLDGQLDLALAAELADISLEELYALNPGFNRWATDPDGPHRLQLPVEAAVRFVEAVAGVPASERVRWLRYRIRPGDSLIAIAGKHHTTVDVLQQVNGLKGSTIRAGAWLMVPTATRGTSDYTLSAANRLAATQNRERPGRTKDSYTVRPGDSLWSIARSHGVGVRDLAAWNGMAPRDTLTVGRSLVVWRPAGKAAVAAPASGAPGRIRQVRYTVRAGDSLHRIASKFRVTVNDLLSWNRLDGGKYLQPGQKLVMFVDVMAQSGGG